VCGHITSQQTAESPDITNLNLLFLSRIYTYLLNKDVSLPAKEEYPRQEAE